MIQEDKELLLKDLCSRLSYGVKAKSQISHLEINTIDGYFVDEDGKKMFYLSEPDFWQSVDDFQYYLRPMSSMTEEEKEELSHLLPKDWSVEIDKLNNFYFDMSPSIFMEIDVFLNIIDWLNAHHFDYRGLIEKGLAIEVTEKNNPYED